MGNTRKKAEKRKAREREIRRQTSGRPERRRSMGSYPKWLLETEGAPARLAELVRAAVELIDFGDDAYFDAEDRQFLRQGAVDGFTALKDELLAEEGTGSSRWFRSLDRYMKLGAVLYARMPQGELEEFLFDNDIQVSPEAGKLRVQVRTLPRVAGRRGTIYHSPHRPSVSLDGKGWVVGFTRHAIERIYDRVVPAWRTCAGHGDAFAFIHDCVYFEPCLLHPAQPGFAVYDECRRGFWSNAYVRELLGEAAAADDPSARYAFRVGYCPAVTEGDFAVAKTLLVPGYKGTPEYGLLLNAPEPRERREELKRKANALSAWELLRTGDFDAIKWFHDHGVPQVIPLQPEQSLFRFSDSGPKEEPELWVLAEKSNGITVRYIEVKIENRTGPLVFATRDGAEFYRRRGLLDKGSELAKRLRWCEPRRKTVDKLRELSAQLGLAWKDALLVKDYDDDQGVRGIVLSLDAPVEGPEGVARG